MLEGLTLTQDIQRISQRVESLRSDVNDRISNMAGNINQLTEKIADLNVKISELQGGSVSKSDAVGLTDQRANALEELASLINTNSVEQPDGTITVYCGGDFLVFAGVSRKVEVVLEGDSGFSTAQIQLADTKNILENTSGELRGLLDSRDTVLNGFLDEFNDFSKTLAYEFNKIYSSGQGLSGYDTLTSAYAVDDSSKALNSSEAGLAFTPKNGSFEVLVRNTKTGLTTSTNVQVNLSGLGHQTTLEDLKTALNGINGIEAEILIGGQLKIKSKSTDSEFSFADDTSGVLAALGVNVFFTGISGRDIGISEYVKNNPALFAASSGGLGEDTKNAEILAQFLDYPIESHNGETLEVMYNSMMASVAQGSSVAKSAADGAKAFQQSLRGEKMAISGVNLDEEAVRMITYQRTYQASAKFISTVSELLQILVSI
jgi:flagellar hook-associated protein 1